MNIHFMLKTHVFQGGGRRMNTEKLDLFVKIVEIGNLTRAEKTCVSNLKLALKVSLLRDRFACKISSDTHLF